MWPIELSELHPNLNLVLDFYSASSILFNFRVCNSVAAELRELVNVDPGYRRYLFI